MVGKLSCVSSASGDDTDVESMERRSRSSKDVGPVASSMSAFVGCVVCSTENAMVSH